MSLVLDLLKELIRCRSITPIDDGCQQIISQRLTRLNFHVEHLRYGEVDNLWARHGNAAPLFVFAGHTDVVPPGPIDEWSTDPFEPSVRHGFLYGRGAADMKSGLAAMVIAAEQFIQQYPDYPGSIGFLITSDEEGPANANGTKKLIEELNKRGTQIDYCIVGEASSDKILGDQVRIGRRGSLSGKLTIYGKQGHVAFPDLAINPVHLSAPALQALTTTTWDEGNAFFPATTFQISNIHAGTGALNVIPGTLEIHFNFRFGTASSVEQLQKKVVDILEKYQLNFNLQWGCSALPFLSKKGSLLTALQKAIQEHAHIEPILSTGGGTSDARFIAPTGAEVIELGGSHASVHQVNEHIRIADLENLAKIYETILKELFHTA